MIPCFPPPHSCPLPDSPLTLRVYLPDQVMTLIFPQFPCKSPALNPF